MDTPNDSDDDFDEDADDGPASSSYPSNFIAGSSIGGSQAYGLSFADSQMGGGYTQTQAPMQMDDSSIMNDAYSQSGMADSQMMYGTDPSLAGYQDSSQSYYSSGPSGDTSMMGGTSDQFGLYSHHSGMEDNKSGFLHGDSMASGDPLRSSSSASGISSSFESRNVRDADKFVVRFMGLANEYAVYAWEDTKFRDIREQLETRHKKVMSDTDHRFELILVESSAPDTIKMRETIDDETNVKQYLERHPDLLQPDDDEEPSHSSMNATEVKDVALPLGFSIIIELNTFHIEIVDGRTPSKQPLIITMVVLESWTLKELLHKLNAGVTEQLAAETASSGGTGGSGSVGSSSLRSGQFTSLCTPEGQEIQPDRSLADHEITYKKAMQRQQNHQHRFQLIHRLEVEIIDIECEIDVVVRVQPSQSIEEMIASYREIAKREEHLNWTLTTSDSSNSGNHTPMKDLYQLKHERVGEVGIQNGDTLDYRVGPYEIHIYDSMAAATKKRRNGASERQAEPERLMVYDHWTLAEVRNEYSQQSGQPVLETEKFLSDDRQLEEGVKLCKLRIREQEQLLIERMADDIAVDYICGDCGATVSLKAMDEVKCRACFHPIVFKKRTGRVCQFNCR